MIKNFYKILGVEYNATDDEIKSAYRRLAKKYHPDLNQGDADAAAKFRNVNEAGETLLDPELRTEHDYLLESKGVHTGRFDRPEPEPEPEPGPQKAEEVKETAKEEKPKKQPPPPVKKPVTRAEKAAAAMQKVRESRKLTRRAVTISVSIILGVILIVASVLLIINFGGKKYTVTFEYGNGLPAHKEVVEAGQEIVKPLDPLRDNYKFEGWYLDPGYTAEASFPFAPTHHLTLYARWTAIVTEQMNITLKFGYDRKDEVVTVTVGSYSWRGTGMETFSPPNRTGYEFAGWYAPVDANDFGSLVIPAGQNADMQKPWSKSIPYLTAKWTPVKVLITLQWDEGEKSNSTYVEYGTKAPLGLPIGFTENFAGWFDTVKGVLVTDQNGILLAPSDYASAVTLVAKYND